ADAERSSGKYHFYAVYFSLQVICRMHLDIWAKETDDINSTSRLDSVIFDFIAAHLRFLLSSPTAS
ncbi:hypothetical protein, partial [Endozoicomonas ascidiicola]|uniref:hypothetical protein n=1 Tax=Endozoicomonas ascidiicola TaxID=1698521 RepID=UPI001C12A18E